MSFGLIVVEEVHGYWIALVMSWKWSSVSVGYIELDPEPADDLLLWMECKFGWYELLSIIHHTQLLEHVFVPKSGDMCSIDMKYHYRFAFGFYDVLWLVISLALPRNELRTLITDHICLFGAFVLAPTSPEIDFQFGQIDAVVMGEAMAEHMFEVCPRICSTICHQIVQEDIVGADWSRCYATGNLLVKWTTSVFCFVAGCSRHNEVNYFFLGNKFFWAVMSCPQRWLTSHRVWRFSRFLVVPK